MIMPQIGNREIAHGEGNKTQSNYATGKECVNLKQAW
jgi:hypothetical protein